MTCIVGLIHNGEVLIGGDSAGVGGYDVTIRKDAKVFRRGEFLIGGTTSFRMLQLLRFRLTVAERPESMDVYEYMVTWFIDAVRECLKAGGYATKNLEVETGGQFLVGYQGRLFKVDNDYQVGESVESYAACGCGEPYALGALWASADDSAHRRVERALTAASNFSAGVRAPFVIEKL